MSQHAQWFVQARHETLGPLVGVLRSDCVDKLVDACEIVELGLHFGELLGHEGLAAECRVQVDTVVGAQVAAAFEAATLASVASERVLVVEFGRVAYCQLLAFVYVTVYENQRIN